MARFGRLSALVTLVITAVAAGAGSALAGSSGSQNVSVTVLPQIAATVVDGSATLAVASGSCGTATVTLNVKSNKAYNLRARLAGVTPGEPGLPSGGLSLVVRSVVATEAGTASASVQSPQVQWSAEGPAFRPLTAEFVDALASAKPKTNNAGANHTLTYRACAERGAAPASYTVTVEFYGVQP